MAVVKVPEQDYIVTKGSTVYSFPVISNIDTGNHCVVSNEDPAIYFMSIMVVDSDPLLFLLTQVPPRPNNIELPYYLEDALDALVSFYLLQNLPSSAEFTNGASRMYRQYKGVLEEVRERMLVRSGSEESYNPKGDAGWR